MALVTRLSALADPTAPMAWLRRALIFLGGFLASQGLIDAAAVEALAAALTTIVGIVLGEIARRRGLAAEPPRT